MSGVDVKKLSMSLGDAMFTQRSVRRLKSDPVPLDLIHLILEAAVKAPNGGNRQPGRFLVVTDRPRVAPCLPPLPPTQGGSGGASRSSR